MKIGIIGRGAIGSYVHEGLLDRGHEIGASIGRSGHVEELADDIDHVVDCAGHAALKQHGPGILRRGFDLTTVSIGALADDALHKSLQQAATDGGATLYLASGAIGGLDCLQAARVGALENVTYIGRKPPQGWRGSLAEDRIDLDALDAATVHFEGSARKAASEYPKNANVAAAVALAGLGFDETKVKLVADPSISENVHEVQASGDFGYFRIEIRGQSLPDNPRSSALAAMSVIARLEQASQPVWI